MPEMEIGIVAFDAQKLSAFYRDGLGFNTVARYDFPTGAVHRMVRGDARCKLFQPAEAPAPREGHEPWFSVAGTRYATLIVENAEAEVRRARAAGAEVVEKVVAHRPGARYALIRDPEGNIWEILEERLPPA